MKLRPISYKIPLNPHNSPFFKGELRGPGLRVAGQRPEAFPPLKKGLRDIQWVANSHFYANFSLSRTFSFLADRKGSKRKGTLRPAFPCLSRAWSRGASQNGRGPFELGIFSAGAEKSKRPVGRKTKSDIEPLHFRQSTGLFCCVSCKSGLIAICDGGEAAFHKIAQRFYCPVRDDGDESFPGGVLWAICVILAFPAISAVPFFYPLKILKIL